MNQEIKFRIKATYGEREWEYFGWRYSESFACELDSCDKKTLGRYTGLKDDAGEEIYEGDLLSIGEGKRDIRLVEYDDSWNAACWCLTKPNMGGSLYGTFQDIYKKTLVGNIHDNPELLVNDNPL